MSVRDDERRKTNLELDARRRAVRMWREHEMSYGKEAKNWAIRDCEEKIKKAYTKEYRQFWEKVKEILEKSAP